MNGVTQSILVDQIAGVPGNCVQAAVATLMELPLEAVPHFVLFDRWNYVLADWVAERGYLLHVIDSDVIPEPRCIAAGISPRGIRHCVVGASGVVAFDPHPSRAGLTSVDEIWFITKETAE